MDDYKTFSFVEIPLKNDYDIMKYVLDKISIDDANSQIVAEILNDKVRDNSLYRKACNVVLYDTYMLMISQFIETDIVTDSIMNVLIPNLITDARQDFYLQVDGYKIVDAIKLFLKTYFNKAIIHDNMFNDISSDIYNETLSFKDDFELSGDVVKRKLDSQELIAKNFYEFFERYFFNVRVVEFVNDYLDRFHVL